MVVKIKGKPSVNGNKTKDKGKRLSELSSEDRVFVANLISSRQELVKSLLDRGGKDINKECGYPKTIQKDDYKEMYDREGTANRAVTLYPRETWALEPEVFDTSDQEVTTPFEKEWNSLLVRMNIWHYLQRVDEQSGIGQFGAILLGLNDGKPLDQPVEGINEDGTWKGYTKKTRDLLYLTVFDETLLEVSSFETNPSNPRYMLPKYYNVTFMNPNSSGLSGSDNSNGGVTKAQRVHWSRMIHVADNRESSEVFGVPRMRPIWNRLVDLRKILGGSGEMFWKGGFPGYSFEVNPELVSESELDLDSLRSQFFSYSTGMQRYLALYGVTAKSLSPQVADPRPHVETHWKAIALALETPFRTFLGTEEGKIAGVQDTRAWARRISRRQSRYVSPMIIRPFVDRLLAFGVLPMPNTYPFQVWWPDLNALTDEDKAMIADKKTNALLKYIQGNLPKLMPPLQFYTWVMGMSDKEAVAMVKAIEEIPQPTAGVDTAKNAFQRSKDRGGRPKKRKVA